MAQSNKKSKLTESERKTLVVKTLLQALMAFNIAVLIYYAYSYFVIYSTETPLPKLHVLIAIVFAISLQLLYKALNDNNVYIIATVAHTLLTAAAAYMFLYDGTVSPGGILIILLVASAMSVVHSHRTAGIYFIAATVTIFLLSLLYQFNVLHFIAGTTDSHPINTLMMLGLVGLILRVVQLGFRELETSYKLVNDYALKLEEAELTLYEQQEWRQKYINQLFNDANSPGHDATLLASITTPMIHDLAAPISVIEGEMINENIHNQRMKRAITTIREMVIAVKLMLQNENTVVAFNAAQIVHHTLTLLKPMLDYHKITLQTHLAEEIILEGQPTLFQRAVVNLISNAVEAHIANYDPLNETDLEYEEEHDTKETKEKAKNKYIDVLLQKRKKHLILKISDNAGGIPSLQLQSLKMEITFARLDKLKALEEAMDEEYATTPKKPKKKKKKPKKASTSPAEHYGLYTTIHTIIETFNGDIKIKSSPELGTSITITIPLEADTPYLSNSQA